MKRFLPLAMPGPGRLAMVWCDFLAQDGEARAAVALAEIAQHLVVGNLSGPQMRPQRLPRRPYVNMCAITIAEQAPSTIIVRLLGANCPTGPKESPCGGRRGDLLR